MSRARLRLYVLKRDLFQPPHITVRREQSSSPEQRRRLRDDTTHILFACPMMSSIWPTFRCSFSNPTPNIARPSLFVPVELMRDSRELTVKCGKDIYLEE